MRPSILKPNIINYFRGDLFAHLPTEGEICIPHIVNTEGKWNKGFVVPLAKAFPYARRAYTEFFKSKKDVYSNKPFELGVTQIVDFLEDNRVVWVANMIAQEGIQNPQNPHPIRYDALRSCMEAIVEHKQEKEQIFSPKFGSGLAGGDWNVIEKMIEEIWLPHFPVTIYTID